MFKQTDSKWHRPIEFVVLDKNDLKDILNWQHEIVERLFPEVEDKPQIVSTQEAYDILSKTDGEEFIAQFIKRDNTLRTMRCKTGVKKNLKGGTLPYNPGDYKNIPVFDLDIEEYRTIRSSSLIKFSIGDRHYLVDGEL